MIVLLGAAAIADEEGLFYASQGQFRSCSFFEYIKPPKGKNLTESLKLAFEITDQLFDSFPVSVLLVASEFEVF